MKKITETAKELGIKFCQDCAQYSWEHCNKFGDHVDPGELACPHFLACTQFAKLKRDIEIAAAANGFVARYEDECDEAVSVTFIKKGEEPKKESDVDKFVKGCEGCTEDWCTCCGGNKNK